MQHSSGFKPRIFPVLGDVADAEIDRAQAIDPTTSLNREKVEEIGRDGAVGFLKRTPTVGYTLTQYEYGNIEFWQKLVNTATKGASGQTEIALSDFKTAYSDICAYLVDDDGTYKGTIWYPGLRTSGFSITIGEPQGIIERSFDLIGESAIVWQGDNKYFIYHREEIETADLLTGDDVEIDLSSREPAEDPITADKYMQRVVRVRGTSSTELESGSASGEYEYSSTAKVLTVHGAEVGDVYKVYYTSATAPATMFSLNDSDPAGLIGDSASIYMYIPATGKPGSSDYIYRLQSATLEVTFDREDIREIGNKDIVARGITDSTVSVTLGRILDQWTVEEALAAQDAGFGKLDIEQFSDQIAIIIKIFDDNTKANFKYGFKATGLSPTEIRGSAGVNEYVTRETTLEGEELVISADSSVIGV